MHTSIKMDTPCEPINITPLNPLISKCQIKVCYVGDEPNRNRSVITKDVARQIANSLPGSPIVGYYNEVEGDFEEHNRTISISNGQFRVKDGTRPYGFVDLGAKCWFQKFLDDGENEHEYLMTEGYLWTGQYPETKRIIEKGNNQSMELDDKLLNAHWTKDSNGKPKFFIINEAIVSKLCILGEECEPCFEGSSITNVQFSFEDDFKQQLFSMMNELKELLSKGGTQVFTTYAVKVGDDLWNAIYAFVDERQYASIDAILSEGKRNFAVLKDNAGNFYSLDFTVAEDGAIQLADEVVAMDNYTPLEEPQFALADVENFVNEYKCGGGSSSSTDDKKKKKKFAKQGKDDKSDDPDSEDNSEGDSSDSSGEDDDDNDPDDDDEGSDYMGKDGKDDKKKKKYNLEEIPEYIDLTSKYSELESKYNALVTEKENLESQLEPLKKFKLDTERVQKQDMIKNQFYMLNDEDKKDVVDHIDEYSLEDIEAKLSVICVRNKVSFAALDDDNQHNDPTTYNLGGNLFQDESTPAWVKAVLEKAKTL